MAETEKMALTGYRVVYSQERFDEQSMSVTETEER